MIGKQLKTEREMADLDDFFAKKDRKKGKSKKLTSNEELASKIDTSKPSQSQTAKKRDILPGQEDDDGINVDEVSLKFDRCLYKH